jgi:TRAP-type transport system small permease protein
MLERFRRFNEVVSGWVESLGFAAVVFMVFLTCADVLGTKLFLWPVPGSLDMMMLAQLIAVSFAAAMTLVRDRHVAVEFFVVRLPKRVQALTDCLVQLLSLILFVIVVWQLFRYGQHLETGREVTPTTRIPIAPFAYAAAAALVPLCLVLLQRLLASILRVMRDEP